MRLEASRSPWLIVAALVVVVGLACSDSTAPIARSDLAFEAPLSGSAMGALTGHVVAGQIVGQVEWHTYLDCCARQYYTGTFVAKRQR